MAQQHIRKIQHLSFLLVCLIVWLHSTPCDEHGSLPFVFRVTGVTNAQGQSAVPFFFFVSGFLFFLSYDPGSAAGKLRRRFRSLVVPYLLWNLLAAIGWLVVEALLGAVYVEPCSRYEGVDGFFYLFLDSGHLSVFWYVRNLIVYAFLSPVAYYAIRQRYIGAALVVLSAAVSISFELPYSGLVYWLPFYLAGCWAGLHRKTFFSLQRPAMAQATLIMLWLLFFTIMVYRPNTRLILLFRLLSPWALTILYDRLHLDVVMKSSRAGSYSFLLYALHWVPLYVLQEYLPNHFPVPTIYYVVYYLLPIVLVPTLLWFIRFLHERIPRVYGLLSGGR